jgi:hypothetical protein
MREDMDATIEAFGKNGDVRLTKVGGMSVSLTLENPYFSYGL